MHDCDDEHVIGLDGVEHRVGKNVDEASSDVLLEVTPARGCLGNLAQGGFDTRDEAKLQTGLAVGIVVRGVLKLVESLRVELIPHHLSRHRAPDAG